MASAASGNSPVWYADGLRFRCTRCGACCGGAPGYIWVRPDEIERIADCLMLPVKEFMQTHCRRVWWRVSLKERDNGDCILLGPDGCTVYPVRPAQCSSFPFWPDVLESRREWEALKGRCPGVGHGRLYSRQEIDEIAAGERRT